MNGELGYKWQPNDAPSIRPVNPPSLDGGETLIRDEPGRCGGLDSHSHHYRLVSGSMGRYYLFVRHGGGDERVPLFKPETEALKVLDSTSCYWLMNAIYHAYAHGERHGQGRTDERWRTAAAEKRIKTRKLPSQGVVKVWIEDRAA